MDAQTAYARVAEVLDTWREGVNTRDSEMIGSVFAKDALFQGGHPQPSRGRQAVQAYYAGQVGGLAVDVRILDVRRSGQGVIVGFAEADFTRPTGTTNRHLTVVLEHTDDAWLIGHYHVSLKPVEH